MKPDIADELGKELIALQDEHARSEARVAYLRRRIQALLVLLEDEINTAIKKPESTSVPAREAQTQMPYEDGRSLIDLVKSVVSTFKMEQEFTSQDVLAELRKIRPSITETSQFGPAMIRLVEGGIIRVNEERRGRSPAKYQRVK